MAKQEKRRDSDGRIRWTFSDIDIDGTRKRHPPDVTTESEARRIQSEVLARVSRGIAGMARLTYSPPRADVLPLARHRRTA